MKIMRRRAFLHAAGSLSLPLAVGRSSAQPSYGPLGRVPLDGLTEVVLSSDGRTAFLAATTGFAIADVSDPRNPTIIAERRNLLSERQNGPLRDIRDVKVDGDRLIVVGPANPTERLSALVLYDVSDPRNPKRVAVHETDYAIHNAFLTGGRAYLSQFNEHTVELAIVDVMDDEPRQVGQWSILDEPGWGGVPLYLVPVHDVWVQNGTAYIAHWDAGTWLLDVRNPRNPTAITHIGGRPPKKLAGLSGGAAGRAVLTPPGNSHYVTVNDDASMLGVGVESWATEGRGGPGGITLWDIETPRDPRKLARIDAPRSQNPTYNGVWTTAHNFDFEGGRLYSSWYRGGVKIHDVSDPRNPRELTHWRRSRKTSFWAATLAVPGEFFVASSWNQYGELPQAALYTFPDRAGESVILTPTDTTTTSTVSGGSATTASGGPTTSRRTKTTTQPTNGTSAGEGAGFGALAALFGVGLGAWRSVRRD